MYALIKYFKSFFFFCNNFFVSERRRSTPAPKEEEKVNEEQWSLREVVFVEDVKNVPVGKVCLKYTVAPSLERKKKMFFLLDKLTV